MVKTKIMTGIIRVSSAYTCVMFDSRATHSIKSYRFTKRCRLVLVSLDTEIYISTPNESVIIIDIVLKSCTMSIGDHELLTKLWI